MKKQRSYDNSEEEEKGDLEAKLTKDLEEITASAQVQNYAHPRNLGVTQPAWRTNLRAGSTNRDEGLLALQRENSNLEAAMEMLDTTILEQFIEHDIRVQEEYFTQKPMTVPT